MTIARIPEALRRTIGARTGTPIWATLLVSVVATAASAQAPVQPNAQPSVQFGGNPGPPPAPACDSGCIRSFSDRASQACAPRIEAEAPTDFDWMTRPHGGIFQQA